MQISHHEVRRHPIWKVEARQAHAIAKPRPRVAGAGIVAAAVLAGAGAWLAWFVAG
jgi:hypothetical protein